MPSPWVELLILHGYITDPKLLRNIIEIPPPMPRTKPEESRGTLARQVVTSLRLCLGIGDGVLRSQ